MSRLNPFVRGLVCMILIISSISVSSCNGNAKYRERIREVLSDTQEIERKWLIDESDIPYDLSRARRYYIEQTYISFSPEIRIRRINYGERYTLTVKTNTSQDGLTRDEFEISISADEYQELLSKKEPGTITVYKTRYQFYDDELGEVLAIDIFRNELIGLAYLEIEFANVEEAVNFNQPDWVIRDVTDRREYKNGSLARYGIPSDITDNENAVN